MANLTSVEGKLGRGRYISPDSRSALGQLAAPEVVSIMEDMLLAADNNNNNNNNNTDYNSNGGSGCAARAGLSREDLLQRLCSSMSDDQLHAILVRHGIL